MKYTILVAALLSFGMNSHAATYSAKCDALNSQAQLRANIQSMPSMVAQNGQDVTNSTKTSSIGIQYSFAGQRRGEIIKSIAKRQCDSIRIVSDIEDLNTWMLKDIERRAAVIEYSLLRKVLDAANEDVELITRQFQNRSVTVQQLNDSISTRLSILADVTRLVTSVNSPIGELPSAGSFNDRINLLVDNNAHINRLTEELQVAGAWDVYISTGVKHQNGGTQNTYFNVGAKYSFGAINSATHIDRTVNSLAEYDLSADQSPTQILARFSTNLANLMQYETQVINLSAEEISRLESIRKHADVAGSELSRNVTRQLDIQIGRMKARKTASEFRLSQYTAVRDSF